MKIEMSENEPLQFPTFTTPIAPKLKKEKSWMGCCPKIFQCRCSCSEEVLCGQYKINTIWLWNLIAAIMHLLNAVAMIYIFYKPDEKEIVEKDVCYQLTRSYAAWNATNGTASINLITKDAGVLSLHWLIVGFHSLSFVFQIIPILFDKESACCYLKRCASIKVCGNALEYPYIDYVKKGRNPIRFLEYSISASLMLVCIALLTGMRDANLLLSIAVLCATCQVFGYVAETLFVEKMFPSVRHVAHVAGWVTLMTAYAIIWVYYGLANANATDGNGAPAFVHGIVITMFLLFNSFGVVQMSQMYCGEKCCAAFYNCVGKNSEASYIFLSIVAKTILGWVIYAQVLVMARQC